jgi:hypothetical protein
MRGAIFSLDCLSNLIGIIFEKKKKKKDYFFQAIFILKFRVPSFQIPPDHLLLDSAPNLGQLMSLWEINKFEDC